jgi:hypothetical protein
MARGVEPVLWWLLLLGGGLLSYLLARHDFYLAFALLVILILRRWPGAST